MTLEACADNEIDSEDKDTSLERLVEEAERESTEE